MSFHPARARPARRVARPQAYRPRVEALEARCLPSTLAPEIASAHRPRPDREITVMTRNL
jgi:hypothetical protein